MAMVSEWWIDFLERHTARIPRADWPHPASPFWEAFRKGAVECGLTEAVADAASERMALAPAPFLDGHHAAFFALVRDVWRESEVVPEASSRDGAERLSRDCPDCPGTGFSARFRHRSEPIGAAVIFYCVCAMGRWLEKSHREGKEPDREAHKRIPDLARHPDMQLRRMADGTLDHPLRHRPRPDAPPTPLPGYGRRADPAHPTTHAPHPAFARMAERIGRPDARDDDAAPF